MRMLLIYHLAGSPMNAACWLRLSIKLKCLSCWAGSGDWSHDNDLDEEPAPLDEVCQCFFGGKPAVCRKDAFEGVLKEYGATFWMKLPGGLFLLPVVWYLLMPCLLLCGLVLLNTGRRCD